MKIYFQFLKRMRKFSEETSKEDLNTHFMLNTPFHKIEPIMSYGAKHTEQSDSLQSAINYCACTLDSDKL